MWAPNRLSRIYSCIYIYMHAVELRTGPIVALLCVKNWSFLFFVLLLCF